MDYREALHRAAAHYGIEPEYIDIWGHRHAPSEDAIRFILESAGVPAGSAEEIEGFLVNQTAAEWSRALDPVSVVREEADFLGLRTPEACAGASVHVEIRWEDGEIHSQQFSLPDLQDLRRYASEDRRFIEKRLPLPRPLRLGYHALRVSSQAEEALGETRLIVCPSRTYPAHCRMAGVGISLFGLRSSRNWGCGDFTDLCAAIDIFARAGAAFIALNPLHAIANRQPFNTSPYLPQNSMYRNFLYLDVEKTPGFLHDETLVREIEDLRASEFVEYERVARIKTIALSAAFERFLACGGAPEFDAFTDEEGAALHDYAVYCALDEEMHARDPNVWAWTEWMEDYRNPRSQAVEAFAQEHRKRVLFFKFLQWQIDIQLAVAQSRARERGMKVGLYHDLALATDRFGADLWANRSYYVSGCRVGAPPDDFAPNGQDWGFPPPNREARRASGYERFTQAIRNCARHGGALRIDHVMRFFRLYWIPDALNAAQGAYVRDYTADLLGILALESVRQQFVVIGEDLGTVDPEIRDKLAEAGILSCRILWFEKNLDGSFRMPREYPSQAAVSTTTHDLPTLSGFFEGRDIEARKAAGLVDDGAYRDQWSARHRDIQQLNQTLKAAGFEHDPLGFVLSSACDLAIVNQEDLTGEPDQQNLPASTWQYPNWRRKMRVPVEELQAFGEGLARRIRESGRL
ncbi:MAG TPA: 4-alpha-glucanotransferase [Bryobacteraceae bacterium]|nr:4-alpha-glucanotransferase [Bryobacteraceae bacterium]